MKKIIKICGKRKNLIILSEEDKLYSANKLYYCKKCQGTSREKIFLCHPEAEK